MKLYYLVDSSENGRKVYNTRFLSDEQLVEEQQKCVDFGGDEFVWIPASPYAASLPKDEIYRHIPSLSEAAQNV